MEKAKKKSSTGILFCTESNHVCKKSLPVRSAFLCGVYATCLSADVVRCVPKWVGLQDSSIPKLRLPCHHDQQSCSDKSREVFVNSTYATNIPRLDSARNDYLCVVIGNLVMLFPAAAYDGVRVDLNETHYTVICRNDELFYPFKLTFLLFPIQFVLPILFIIYVNVSLIRTVWIKRKRQICYRMNNVFKAHLRATRIKGISP